MMKDSSIRGFSEEAARALVGARVRKRALDNDNPSVSVGQMGEVIGYEEASGGYGVVVVWGGDDTWFYEVPDEFEADAEVMEQ